MPSPQNAPDFVTAVTRTHLRSIHPVLLDSVVAAVREAMRAQGRSLSGGQGHGLTFGVETAVATFTSGADLEPTLAVFAGLGRTEYREGHRVDALRSILTVGAQTLWAALVESPGPAEPPELYVIAAALFGYVDALAGAAAEGYLDEQRDAAHDWAQARRRLITLLVQPDPPAEPALQAAAEAARWPLPSRVRAVSVEGTDAEHLARAAAGGTIATVIDGATRLLCPAAVLLDRALSGRRAAIGPVVPLREARRSYRISRRALSLQQSARLPDGPLDCDDHLVALLLSWEPGVAARLADRSLAPLSAASPATRRTLAETLHAWLRAQGQVIPAAQALHTHPQTVRYRLRRLRELFGAALDDPDARLALQLSLQAGVVLDESAPRA
ncbi:helix-turn-helix domain-containing protein [Dactylosporangium darangshiense]|uniref:Helix-turn-helix domain-containing protein n=1 Tax=Dactylosporangium darangshiense TaxID=579108 RepID=A0ABP8DKM8_9ACTN